MPLTKVTHWDSPNNWPSPEYLRQLRSCVWDLGGVSGMARRLDSAGTVVQGPLGGLSHMAGIGLAAQGSRREDVP